MGLIKFVLFYPHCEMSSTPPKISKNESNQFLVVLPTSSKNTKILVLIEVGAGCMTPPEYCTLHHTRNYKHKQLSAITQLHFSPITEHPVKGKKSLSVLEGFAEPLFVSMENYLDGGITSGSGAAQNGLFGPILAILTTFLTILTRKGGSFD